MVLSLEKYITEREFCLKLAMLLASKNASRANIIVVCRFISVYIASGPKVRVKTRVQIRALKVVKVKIEVLLSLVEAFLTSLCLLLVAGLWQVLDLAFQLIDSTDPKSNYNFYFFEQTK